LAYLFLLPSFVIILVFGLYPVFNAGYISLHDWSIVKGAFVGVENYRVLARDPDFAKALQVTVFYVIASVPVTMLISLVIAYLLFKPILYRGTLRTLYFLPYITSLVPAAMVWQWIFNSQSGILNYIAGGLSRGLARLVAVLGQGPWIYPWMLLLAGWIVYLHVTGRRRAEMTNWLLTALAGILLLGAVLFLWRPDYMHNTVKQFETFFPVRWLQEPRGIIPYLGLKWGFKPPMWLQGPSMALIAVSVVSIWHFAGYNIVIYLAGLFNVPPELYEAARIDGASEGQVFWKITLPLLSPTTFFLLITSTIGAFRAFTMFYVLTNGGPLRTTTSVTFMIYERFYNAGRWGYASAIAFVLFGIILAMTLLNQWLAGRHVVYQ
jgi:multiple sugar transport system permease protein